MKLHVAAKEYFPKDGTFSMTSQSIYSVSATEQVNNKKRLKTDWRFNT
jgi:hypothetical protein